MTESPLHVSPSSQAQIQILVSKILEEFNQKYRLDLAGDPAAVQRIQEAAGAALRTLLTEDQAEIYLPYLSANNAGPIHLRRTVYRSELGLEQLKEGAPENSAEVPESEPVQVKVPLPDRKPLVTTLMLVLMVVFYALQLLTGFLYNQDLPAVWGMKINEAILAGQYWRLITPMLLHGSILHLGFNLYALYILGRRIERFFGSLRFLQLFLIAGITGNIFSFIFTPAPSLGSSTAIFGLLAAEGVFIYQHRNLFGDRFKIALRQIIQVAVINILIGLSPGIDNWGHIGGLIGGGLFAWFAGPSIKLEGKPPHLRFADQRPTSASLLVAILQLVLLAALTGWIVLTRI